MCLGPVRCTRGARMEVEAQVPTLHIRRDALFLFYEIKTAGKACLSTTAAKFTRQHHHLHIAGHRSVMSHLNYLCQLTGL